MFCIRRYICIKRKKDVIKISCEMYIYDSSFLLLNKQREKREYLLDK